MRPLGDRVLIRPEANPEMTESGLHLAEHAKPATAGTVVSVGLAEHPLKQDAIECAGFLRGYGCGGKKADGWLRRAADTLEAATQREPLVHPGDFVLFSWQSGQEFWIDDERLLIMRESDILAVVEE